MKIPEIIKTSSIDLELDNMFLELKCPKCGEDMKEYVNTFRCRNKGNCNYEYKKYFQHKVEESK